METTGILRNRLGFTDPSVWKQFCTRRLQLIHNLSLNLRKASEQEEQVKALASELCSEYGLPGRFQPDFEKLLIAGIQSVRRNQKRSSRHSLSVPHHLKYDPASNSVANSNSHGINIQNLTTDSRCGSAEDNGYRTSDHESYLSSSADSVSSLSERLQSSQFAQRPPPNLAQSLSTRIAVVRDLVRSSAGSRVECSTPASVKASAYGILSIAVSTAVINAKLSNYAAIEFNDAIWSGPLLDALRDIIDHRLTKDRLFECMGSLAASLVHGPSFLGALQALFVCLVQGSHGSVPRMIQVLRQMPPSDISGGNFAHSHDLNGLSNPMNGPISSHHPQASIGSNNAMEDDIPEDAIVPSASSVGGPDKQVTLRYNDKYLRMVYSPRKATPPTVGEIIDTGRQLFNITTASVVRLRDTTSGKIIESNAELIDSFTLPEIFLELIVPPPMLLDVHKIQPNPSDSKFTPLAPLVSHNENKENSG